MCYCHLYTSVLCRKAARLKLTRQRGNAFVRCGSEFVGNLANLASIGVIALELIRDRN
jgi:hypothetical protein